MKYNVEFEINVKPAIYLAANYSSVDDFFNKSVVKYIAKDYDFIVSLMQKQKTEEEQKKYKNYLLTLQGIKGNIENSISFELKSEEGDTQTLKVKCGFDYYDNEIQTAEKAIQVEIFYVQIKSNRFLARDFPRIGELSKIPQDLIDAQIALYTHVADLLEAALPSLAVKLVTNTSSLEKTKNSKP